MKDSRSIALSAVALAFLITGAKLSVHLGPVPLTFQTFAHAVVLLWLGPKLGLRVAAAYLLLGLLGLPVFAGGGGPAYVMKPSFGYLLGFPTGFALARFSENRKLRLLLLLVANYGLGCLYLGLSLGLSPARTLTIGFLPTIVKDTVLTGLAYVLFEGLAGTVRNLGVNHERSAS